MPLVDEKLIVEPTYPHAEALSTLMDKPETEAIEADIAQYKIRNTFWSWRYRCTAYIFEKDGKIAHGLDRLGFNRIAMEINTSHCVSAWGIEQEAAAIQTLTTLLRHHQFKSYMLTGMFMEASQRSGVHYLFRKLRPTVALTLKGKTPKVLAALCMHPIAYYEGTWAGAMTPTDEVIAHLMLMRGDEHMYWRRANQHPAWMPQAGL